MKIIVTGAAGFIGSHLSERLVELGHSVYGIDCLINNYPKFLKLMNIKQLEEKGVLFLNLDLANDNLIPVTKDINFVFHLAAQPGIDDKVPFSAYERNNVLATYRLLEAIKQSSSLLGFINISTSSVYGVNAIGDEHTEPKPISYYGVTKLAAEQLILSTARDQQRFPACSLRLYSVYGPRERPEKLFHKLISSILEDHKFPLAKGSYNHLRSFTYIDDIIDGLILTMNNINRCIGEIFNIGSDKKISTGAGIKIVEEILGKRAKFIEVQRRYGDQLKTHANINKARQILNYSPNVLPREGLERQIMWHKNNFKKLLNKSN